MAGLRLGADGVDDHLDLVVLDDGFDLDLLDLVDDELADPGGEHQPHLLAVTGDVGDGDPVDPLLLEAVLHALQPLGPDYCHYHLHGYHIT